MSFHLYVLRHRFLLYLVALIAPTAAASNLNEANTSWILTSTALVLFMTIPGLSLFYGGLVRSKNVLSVLVQCFSVCCLASLLWLIVGYSLAFGDGGSSNWLIGNFDNFLMSKQNDILVGRIKVGIFDSTGRNHTFIFTFFHQTL